MKFARLSLPEPREAQRLDKAQIRLTTRALGNEISEAACIVSFSRQYCMSELGPKMLMSTVDCPDFAFFYFSDELEGPCQKRGRN